ALAQPDCAILQFVIGEGLHRRLALVHLGDDRLQRIDVAVVGRAEYPLGKSGKHEKKTSNPDAGGPDGPAFCASYRSARRIRPSDQTISGSAEGKGAILSPRRTPTPRLEKSGRD